MRIRILKNMDVTIIQTSNNSGTVSVQESTKTLELGKIIGGAFEVLPNPDDTVDIYLVNDRIIVNVPMDAIEVHGDKPSDSPLSKNCCKERK